MPNRETVGRLLALTEALIFLKVGSSRVLFRKGRTSPPNSGSQKTCKMAAYLIRFECDGSKEGRYAVL
uniref:Uncharacterized protein n=1 Tax=Anguilla anguilla TaxID=7936 RepID=A0A0E9XTB0_ANGAN